MNKSTIFLVVSIIILGAIGIVYYFITVMTTFSDFDNAWEIEFEYDSDDQTSGDYGNYIDPNVINSFGNAYEYDASSEEISEETEKSVNSTICQKQLLTTESKTVCYVAHDIYEPSTYDEANRICENHAMKLYKFDSAESYNGWLTLASSIWTPYYGAAVWVNGKRDDECSGQFKIVDDIDESQILGDIEYENLINCGQCLKMWNVGSHFTAKPEKCSTKMTFFCEFY